LGVLRAKVQDDDSVAHVGPLSCEFVGKDDFSVIH